MLKRRSQFLRSLSNASRTVRWDSLGQLCFKHVLSTGRAHPEEEVVLLHVEKVLCLAATGKHRQSSLGLRLQRNPWVCGPLPGRRVESPSSSQWRTKQTERLKRGNFLKAETQLFFVHCIACLGQVVEQRCEEPCKIFRRFTGVRAELEC